MILGRLAGGLVVLALVAASPALAQPGPRGDDDAPFIELLRRQDPALAERFIALRDARIAAAGHHHAANARPEAPAAGRRDVGEDERSHDRAATAAEADPRRRLAPGAPSCTIR